MRPSIGRRSVLSHVHRFMNLIFPTQMGCFVAPLKNAMAPIVFSRPCHPARPTANPEESASEKSLRIFVRIP